MSRAVSLRLDDETLRALGLLQATGLTKSQAVRQAVLESADRLRRRQALVGEVVALEADEEDWREMRQVAELMEGLRAPW